MDPFRAKLVAAATGSTMTALTMTPFDVVKTRLQTQPKESLLSRTVSTRCCQPPNVPCVRNMSSLVYTFPAEKVVCVYDHGVLRRERVSGFVDAIRHVVRAEGVRGLWKGVGTTLVIGVPSSTMYMLTYDHLLRNVMPQFIPSPTLAPLFAGITARTLLTSLLSPLELVRTNLQSTPKSPDQPHTLSSVLGSVRTAVRQRGIGFLWRGLGPTLWRDVPFSGIYWAGYEAWKRHFESRGKTGPNVAFASGAISGTTASLLTSPFDVLKTRQQALLMSGTLPSRETGTIPLCLRIMRTEGAGALFAGVLPRTAKIAPACGIMIACFEGVGKTLTTRD
ncbi:mitochondrial carrier domain-containing protein [Boletus edulis BED1]|uniref:Mitochondrial carrier domain-containing protein n=1 Tax=Boletus edulis BED1 TaxID=1328754 RepID=A0AAD4C2D7_BOLED|nr:mitochondrial carrier domain-containing protein [Boletus edulis BED1]